MLLKIIILICTSGIVVSSTSSENRTPLVKTDTTFNGIKAHEYSAPWIVSIMLDDIFGETRVSLIHRCSGTILTVASILTTNNCVSNLPESNQLIITAGVFESSILLHQYKQVGYPSRIIKSTEADIAMIRLTKNLIFNNLISPLNFNLNFYDPSLKFEKGYQFGFKLRLNVSTLETKFINLTNSYECDSYGTFCVKAKLCSTADIGSPLIVYDQFNVPNLWGLWTHDECASSENISRYTSVKQMKQFIAQNII